MARQRVATWMRRSPKVENGRFVDHVEQIRVRVMTTDEGYAMVRRPRGFPFVVAERELRAEGAA